MGLVVRIDVQNNVHQAGDGLADSLLVVGELAHEAIEGIEPLQYALGSLQDRHEATDNAEPGPIGMGVVLEMLVEDGEQLLLQTVGGGIVVLLVAVEVGGNDVDEAVGEREGRIGDEGIDGLGQVLQRPAIHLVSEEWTRWGEARRDERRDCRTRLTPTKTWRAPLLHRRCREALDDHTQEDDRALEADKAPVVDEADQRGTGPGVELR